ncbi:MAG: ABC transporter ATP-binding protein [Rhizobiales bacterium]|mgnify:FL=1|nr:ABC transporter ATP-binding protein [Hyphomicrobiales bacterium]
MMPDGKTTAPPARRSAPEVTLAGLGKTYRGAARPTFTDLSLTCPAGRITVIVGPSGCGKTTLLRCVCGLEDTSAGTIRFGERDVTKVDAERRGVAMVFQNYALYPDKTVAGNIGFPLRMARMPKPDIERRVAAAARLVRIEDYLGRRPSELSGGQRQRVGIARAIVRGPDVLMMDEPLSNLDTKLRAEMRAELGALQRQIGATTIYVTHDQTEALTLADHLVVMRGGVIEQQGSPEDVFLAPRNTFVADFMGRMNLIEGKTADGRLTTGDGAEARLDGYPAGREVVLGFRPEEVALGPAAEGGLTVSAPIERRELLGTEVLVTLRLGERLLRVRVPVGTPLDGTITVSVPPRHLHFFGADGGRIDFAAEALPRRQVSSR